MCVAELTNASQKTTPDMPKSLHFYAQNIPGSFLHTVIVVCDGGVFFCMRGVGFLHMRFSSHAKRTPGGLFPRGVFLAGNTGVFAQGGGNTEREN